MKLTGKGWSLQHLLALNSMLLFVTVCYLYYTLNQPLLQTLGFQKPVRNGLRQVKSHHQDHGHARRSGIKNFRHVKSFSELISESENESIRTINDNLKLHRKVTTQPSIVRSVATELTMRNVESIGTETSDKNNNDFFNKPEGRRGMVKQPDVMNQGNNYQQNPVFQQSTTARREPSITQAEHSRVGEETASLHGSNIKGITQFAPKKTDDNSEEVKNVNFSLQKETRVINSEVPRGSREVDLELPNGTRYSYSELQKRTQDNSEVTKGTRDIIPMVTREVNFEVTKGSQDVLSVVTQGVNSEVPKGSQDVISMVTQGVNSQVPKGSHDFISVVTQGVNSEILKGSQDVISMVTQGVNSEVPKGSHDVISMGTQGVNSEVQKETKDVVAMATRNSNTEAQKGSQDVISMVTREINSEVPRRSQDVVSTVTGEINTEVPKRSHDADTMVTREINSEVPKGTQDFKSMVRREVNSEVPKVTQNVNSIVTDKATSEVGLLNGTQDVNSKLSKGAQDSSTSDIKISSDINISSDLRKNTLPNIGLQPDKANVNQATVISREQNIFHEEATKLSTTDTDVKSEIKEKTQNHQKVDNSLDSATINSKFSGEKSGAYLKYEVEKMASKKALNGTILISVVDRAYLEMALNFWETSITKFNITNHLFICLDGTIKTLLPDGCYVAAEDQDSRHPSRFGTAGFNRKVATKTKVSLDLLLLGYNVIVVDVDIVFFQNPLPYLKCDDCDLLIQNDKAGVLNTGFYLIKPSKAAIDLQKRSVKVMTHTNHPNDQDIMNDMISNVNKTLQIKVKVLDYHLFQPGELYFSKNNFANDSNCNCVMVHNNWILNLRDKIYRFKEMLLWMVDANGYYTCTENNYITYDNPVNSTKIIQLKALDFAFKIGAFLNRTVILPQFYCRKRLPAKRCHLLQAFGSEYLKIKKESTYRESVFLQHPKVPTSTKSSVSQAIDFRQFMNNDTKYPPEVLAEVIAYKIKTSPKLNQFKVIKFHSLT